MKGEPGRIRGPNILKGEVTLHPSEGHEDLPDTFGGVLWELDFHLFVLFLDKDLIGLVDVLVVNIPFGELGHHFGVNPWVSCLDEFLEGNRAVEVSLRYEK